jgi:hypothetical protein
MAAGAFSPVAFIATFLFVDSIATLPAGTDGPACLPNEAGIGATAVLAIAHELELFTESRRAHHAVGDRAVASAP